MAGTAHRQPDRLHPHDIIPDSTSAQRRAPLLPGLAGHLSGLVDSSSVALFHSSLGLVLRRLGLAPRRVLEKRCVDGARGQMDVADDRTANKHVFGRTLKHTGSQPSP